MRLLLVEDSRTSVRMIEGLLAEEEEKRDYNFDLSVATSMEEARATLARQSFDLILLDLTLPDSHGLDTVDSILKAAPQTAVVVLTSTDDETVGLKALQKGAQDFLVKDETYRKVLVRSVRYAYQRNLAEQAIREAKDMAEFATSSKSSFIANLSHELRTPLNAIIGFSDMMLSQVHGSLHEKYLEYATDINKSGRYLLGLIGTVLDMSKIEARKIELRDEELEPDGFLRDAAAAVQLTTPDYAERVLFDIADGLPRLRVDRTKLQQVVINLVSNALKYSPDGGPVTVAAHLSGDGEFVLTVTDSGIGIPEDQIATVLEPFKRTDVSKEKEIEGTGLGLPLSKGLVEAHGGRLSLESTAGRGTTVTVTLPPERLVR